MILTSLRKCALSKDGLAWYVSFVSSFERRDLEAMTPLLDDEVVFELNNALPFYGKRTVCAALERFWASFESVEYEPSIIYGEDNSFGAELLTHCVRHDGVLITMPMAAFYERNAAGLMTASRIFSDFGPVYE